MPAKIIIKKGLSAVFSGCGLFYALDHYCLADKAFVLMYHRVISQDNLHDTYVQPGMYVTGKSFDRQMSFLREKYQILFLEELIDKVNRNEKISGCCAITFDDGWRDNYTDAFPILKKYQVPATIFLATAYIGTNRLFWPEEVCCHLEQSPLSTLVCLDNQPLLTMLHLDTEKFKYRGKEVYFNKVIEVLKGYHPDDRDYILQHFRKAQNPWCSSRQILSWEEVDEMHNSGLVTFGAHTSEHVLLDEVSVSKAKSEVIQSREIIERRLKTKATIFAYPNGNYNKDVVNVLYEGDFAGAVTTRKGFLDLGVPLMEIPRIGVHEDICDTVSMFQGRILLKRF